jgi:N-formylglutamate amidohydrolase
VPESLLPDFLLDLEGVRAEAKTMADIYTEDLARLVVEKSPRKPWVFENTYSRLVIDPERFPDDSEVMNQVGMGVVYSKTSDQRPLRKLSEPDQDLLIDRFFKPYSKALETLVAERLDALGKVLIIDLHSYPAKALPYELYQDSPRPEVCLGVDSFHTPEALIDLARDKMSELGSVEINTPFVGTYVPLKFYGSEPKVHSIMLELRKDIYLADGLKSASFDKTADCIAGLVKELS